jgi:hypothetical protein
MNKKVKLLPKHIKLLHALPEQGMGYQIVDIELIGGIELLKRTILNSTYLIIVEGEDIDPRLIRKIILHKNKNLL